MALTPKRRKFVEAYLATWNASEAARQAGYGQRANVAGPRLMANDSIREAIEQRIKESAMQADEVLSRLAEQARCNISEFITEEITPLTNKSGEVVGEVRGIGLNWDAIRKRGHLIKSISATQYGPKIEMHDGQTALVQIGRALRLFTDQYDLTVGPMIKIESAGLDSEQ